MAKSRELYRDFRDRMPISRELQEEDSYRLFSGDIAGVIVIISN